MDTGRARRRWRWLAFWLVLIGAPVLAFVGFVLAFTFVMSTFD